MNMNKTLSDLIQNFFYQRLINQRDSSQRTISTYRDTFRLLLGFSQEYLGKKIDKLQLLDLNADVVLKFLDHLESKRKNSRRTRNNRLAAIRSFMQYVALEEPTALPMVEKVVREALSQVQDTAEISIRLHPELKLTKVVVSEAGASIYSASAFASQELPGLDQRVAFWSPICWERSSPPTQVDEGARRTRRVVSLRHGHPRRSALRRFRR